MRKVAGTGAKVGGVSVKCIIAVGGCSDVLVKRLTTPFGKPKPSFVVIYVLQAWSVSGYHLNVTQLTKSLRTDQLALTGQCDQLEYTTASEESSFSEG